MTNIINTYDTKIDSKKRITLRSASFNYYHVEEHDNGTIVLEPRELTKPFEISANTLKMMDTSIANIKKSKVSKALDLSKFKG